MSGETDDLGLIRRAQLANMRQELLAPVGAIVGYGEMLQETAARAGLDRFAPDLDRVLKAARALFDAVNRLLDREANPALAAGADLDAVQRALRHDLRTPINVIRGYAELVLEELEDGEGEGLRPDLEHLLAESARLLGQIDSIIDFSQAGGEAADGSGGAAAAEMFAEVIRSIRPPRAAPAEDRVPGRILVVDDIATNRELLARRLSQEGHRVEGAEGGRQALERLEAEPFDLVLLDLMMPDLNGFEVLERMRASPALKDVPVIMISALDETDSVIRCIEAGADDYLPKPFNPVLLRARINACLERKRWRDRERSYLAQIESEKEKHERLLHNILPGPIVGRLNSGEAGIADRFEDVSVLFADLVGFTEMSSRLAPSRIVALLNRLFSEFDAIVGELGVEKIKMIGDGYMVVGGVPEGRPDHAHAVVRTAQRMLEAAEGINRTIDERLALRIGIHSGPVVAGIVGTHRFLYDVWGDTVNVASRLEELSLPNRVHVSAASAAQLRDAFALEPRGGIEVKGKGRLETFFLAEAPPSAPRRKPKGA